MAQTLITITHDKEVANDVKQHIQAFASAPKTQIARLENFINALGCGTRMGTMTVAVGDGALVPAAGTFTLSAPMTAGDTILINGVTLTVVASGAVNNQINVGGTAAAQALNVVSAINSSTTPLVSGTVVGSAVGGVVTVTAIQSGQVGNAISIAKGVDAGSVDTVSGARLSGGADTTNFTAVTYKYGVL